MKVESVLDGRELNSDILDQQDVLTLQIPQATVHSSLVADAWFA